MIFVKHTKKEPIKGMYYLVYCPDYCSAGFEVAEWKGEEWDNYAYVPIHPRVEAYYPVPLTETEIELPNPQEK